MSNFTFLPSKFSALKESATAAEAQIIGDPRAACFHARFALEATVHWLYRYDSSLRMPYDRKLGALIHEPTFINRLPQAIYQKVRLLHALGNVAVHERKRIEPRDALVVVKDLHQLGYWMVWNYHPAAKDDWAVWDDAKVPRPADPDAVVPREELQALEEKLAKQNENLLRQQQERDAVDAELKVVRDQLEALRKQAEEAADPHDYGEAETRKRLIDVDLRRSGWPLDGPHDLEYKVTGMPNAKGEGFADYVLWGDDGKPLGVVEAKRATENPEKGQQQAKLYADCLETMHGQRPVIFYTNGYDTWIWDDSFYPPRTVAGVYGKDDLQRIVQRREIRKPLDVAAVNEAIAGRYYQKRAIGSIGASFAEHQRKALLVMATGTGKTRTAIALVDLLQKANWAKRVLFLADRVSLVNQAAGAFKEHLPDSSPVNLVTEKDKEGRVYVCTYPTMMGLIDETKDGEARFGPGYFDLVIIDEAHRSVYQRYRDIFRYFDSFLVGLTATPREQVDKNTYDLFELESGVPTDAYELEEAVSDGFLVPPTVKQVDLKFPREGITYDDLAEDEKAQWEETDWGDNAPEGELAPHAVNAGAVNNWLFNTDTADKVLQFLMEHGHTVEAGDRLGKTIIFARNHNHAKFIEDRFNHHYPHYAGHFARVIDNYAKYPQSLIDDFSIKDKDPHIAISVDMLDTGIDVPEVLNLVFFKPVYSKIKFWQMIGRGTRLCPDLFPEAEDGEQDKPDFRIFDFCGNFDFFKENPDGFEGSGGASLSSRLFRARLDLVSHLQKDERNELESEEKTLQKSLKTTLHQEVEAMNPENFIVRMRLETVERFQKPDTWKSLSGDDLHELSTEIAGLPSEQDTDDLEARQFDLTALNLQLTLATKDANRFERIRQSVMEVAGLLEAKDTIPAVKEQLAYLQAVQTVEFWEGINLTLLEELRERMRGLVRFIDRKKRKIVYTQFEDEIKEVRFGEPLVIPKMTGPQYEKKVREFLIGSLDHIAIQKLRQNEALTPQDLEELERLLVEIGEDEGEALLSKLLITNDSPSLVHFVRKLVGLDRKAAQGAFAGFLDDRSLSPAQIRFVELVIDQLTSRGVIEASALYEAPFSDAGGPEVVFAGKEKVIEGIFEKLQLFEPPLESSQEEAAS